MSAPASAQAQAELRAEAVRLASEDLDHLLNTADQVRRQRWGARVSFCAIVNARCGVCSEDCAFCAQSSHHDTDVSPFGLIDADAMVDAARRAGRAGAARMGIVTSGSAISGCELDDVCAAVARITDETGVAPCASLGSLSPQAARSLRDAGLSRYHHNLETSERFFPHVCTSHTYEDRVRTVRVALDAGLEVCAGGLFGMGETWEDRIDLALALRELSVSSIPINFLMPVPGTPMGGRPLLSADDALRTIALFRMLSPEAEVRVCGGRDLVLGSSGDRIYQAGATGAMIGDYLTQPGGDPAADLKAARALGLEVA